MLSSLRTEEGEASTLDESISHSSFTTIIVNTCGERWVEVCHDLSIEEAATIAQGNKYNLGQEASHGTWILVTPPVL